MKKKDQEKLLKAVKKLNAIDDDQEAAHIQAEDVVLEFLRDIGYGAVADGFDNVRDRNGFWYS